MDGNDHKKLKKSPKENIFLKNIVLKEEKKGGLTILFSLFHHLSLMPTSDAPEKAKVYLVVIVTIIRRCTRFNRELYFKLYSSLVYFYLVLLLLF